MRKVELGSEAHCSMFLGDAGPYLKIHCLYTEANRHGGCK